ncbi:ABC transporter permease [Enterococcus sp. HY326]|uniref:ABC transporter permease n=1 Tax=Enterococcus sp. HY326 TaxID=2971265 RepID=UPI00224094B2|nr:ABC transporter permease [Enterococcus sp. HY326]
MSIFKAMLYIIKKNRWSLLLIVLINVAISGFNARNFTDNTTLDLTNSKISIYNHDQGDIGQSLSDYLASQSRLVTLADNQKARDDALYFGKTDYILTIPADFSESFLSGNTDATLAVQTQPGSFGTSLLETRVNQYLNTLQTFNEMQQEETLSVLLTQTAENLKITGTLVSDSTYAENNWRQTAANIYNLLAYGLFGTIFSGIATIYLSFNRPEIRERNRLAPLSAKNFNGQLGKGLLLFSLITLLVFLTYNFVITGMVFSFTTLLFCLSSGLFFLTAVTFSQLIAQLSKRDMVITIVNNIYILGSCFISGVLVPVEYLPSFVKNIAMFTPTYWFVDLNSQIAETSQYGPSFYQGAAVNGLILITFAIAFVVISRVLQKEKNQQLWSNLKNNVA